MDIHLTYTLRPEEFIEFQRTYLKLRKTLNPRYARQRLIATVVISIYLAVMLGLILLVPVIHAVLAPPMVFPGMPAPALSDSLYRSFANITPWLIVFCFIWGSLFWLRRSKRLFRRAFTPQSKLQEPHAAHITDASVTITLPGCVTIMEWSYFICVGEGPTTFTLYTSPSQGHILPKRAFPSPAHIDDFRKFAQAHVRQQTQAFPVDVQPSQFP